MKKGMQKCLIGGLLLYNLVAYDLRTSLHNVTAKYVDAVETISVLKEENASFKSTYYTDLPIQMQFEIAAEAYNMDWKLVYAIAAHETGWFSSYLFTTKNNPGGIKCGESCWAAYDNSFQGILEMTRLLKKSYIDKGLDTFEAIGPVYCPNSPTWIEQVKTIYYSLK